MKLACQKKTFQPYKAIQSFSDSLEKTCIASKANEKLNRYSNISPFDYNRVVLNDDEFENDYINASYVNVRSLVGVLRKVLNIFLFFVRVITIHTNTSQRKVPN